MPVRVAVTADRIQAIALIDSIAVQFLLADRGYDSNAIRGIATKYAKALTSFEAAVQIRCIALWLKVLA